MPNDFAKFGCLLQNETDNLQLLSPEVASPDSTTSSSVLSPVRDKDEIIL